MPIVLIGISGGSKARCAAARRAMSSRRSPPSPSMSAMIDAIFQSHCSFSANTPTCLAMRTVNRIAILTQSLHPIAHAGSSTGIEVH